MKIFLIVAGALGLLIALWVVQRARFYRKMFSDAHLCEVAARLPGLRQAALDGVTVATPQMGDLRALLTTAGLVILYTIQEVEDGSRVHHVSVSLGGSYTPYGIGSYFLLFVLKGLGVELARVACLISETQVFHADWTLSAAAQSAFTAQPAPAIAAPRALWEECVALRPQIQFQRRSVPNSTDGA